MLGWGTGVVVYGILLYFHDINKKNPYQPDFEVSYHLLWINLANLGHSRKSLLINLFINLSEKMSFLMI